MDQQIEEALINYVKLKKIPANIYSEEIGTVKFHSTPKYLIVFDPLDGSTNYAIGKNLLPFGLLIAVFKGVSPKLGDVVVAGASEYTTNSKFIFDGKKTTTFNGKSINLNKKWAINSSTPIYLDLYYKKGYKAFLPIAQQLHIRWTGSNIGSLNYVMHKMAGLMGAVCMRPEEIGTMVALIIGAGGVAIDHKGKNLINENFSTKKTYQLLAGNKKVVQSTIKLIKN
jgi:fructose-1,6-bisphosphatase/inositol monophosphatase family enzyme